MIVLIVIIYLIGAVLAYGRVCGGFYEIQERFYPHIEIDNPLKASLWSLPFFVFLSWIAFFAGSITYFTRGEKYFFKYKWDYHPNVRQ